MYVCHDLSFNVFGSLANPTRKRWAYVVYTTLGITILIFVMTGMSGTIITL